MKSILFTPILVFSLAAAAQQNPPAGTPKEPAAQAPQSGSQDKPYTPTASRNRLPDSKELMVNLSEQKMVQDAAQGGMLQVELGQLAQKQGSGDSIKQAGEKMVKEHTAVNDELKKLAALKNIEVAGDLDPKHRATADKLAKLNGAAFDKAYAKALASEHKKAISVLERIDRNAYDSDLKAFAAKHIPHFREHLTLAPGLTAK